MANRRYIDPSEFTDRIGARDLQANAIRKANPYDAYASQTEFDVIVLTIPLPLSTEDANEFLGTGDITTINNAAAKNNSGFCFRGRIIGKEYMSPHESLPNPCQLSIASDPATAARIAALHTLFISGENIGIDTIPEVGTTVRVSLATSEHKFNLQYAYFDKVRTVSRTESASSALQQCSNLAAIFDNFDYQDISDVNTIDFDENAGLVVYVPVQTTEEIEALAAEYSGTSLDPTILSSLHPTFRTILKAFAVKLRKDFGNKLILTSGYRSYSTQKDMRTEYDLWESNGRVGPKPYVARPSSPPGPHTVGMAIDCNVANSSGNIIARGSDPKQIWEATGAPAVARAMRLTWGGGFKDYDPVHFQAIPPGGQRALFQEAKKNSENSGKSPETAAFNSRLHSGATSSDFA